MDPNLSDVADGPQGSGMPVSVETSDDLNQWHNIGEIPSGYALHEFALPGFGQSSSRFFRARFR